MRISDKSSGIFEWSERQRAFSQMVAEHYAVRGDAPKALVRTYGCQQNVSDGEKLRGMLAEMGFSFTLSESDADLILFNTCAVREHAEDRIFGNVGAIRRFRKDGSSPIVALCGCMTQQSHIAEKIKKSYPAVRLVFGTHVLHKLPELLFEVITTGKRVFDLSDGDVEIAEGLPVRRETGWRAWIPILYGCNNFCSYCVVPYVRGRERSREPELIIKEAEELIAGGCRELNLLGQNVNSYSNGFPELLKKLNGIPGAFWIRFMTSHPKDASNELFAAMAESEKVCRHLHLPFQAGNNRVLRQMNRRYTREEYCEKIAYAREKMPDLSVTSDVIVGFPGETDEEFQDTLDLVRDIGFSALYTFIFSPRKGTPAEKMDDPIPHSEKVKRFQALLALQDEITKAKTAGMKNEIHRVLVESESDNHGFMQGKTSGNFSVRFPGSPELSGDFANIKITGNANWVLLGETL